MSEVAVEHVAHLDVVAICRFADAKREAFVEELLGDFFEIDVWVGWDVLALLGDCRLLSRGCGEMRSYLGCHFRGDGRTGGLGLVSDHVAVFVDGRGRALETSLLLLRCFRFDRSMMEVVAGSFLLFRFCPSSMMAVVARSKQIDCCSVVFVSTAR